MLTKYANSKISSKKQQKKLAAFLHDLAERTPVPTNLEAADLIGFKIDALLSKSSKILDKRKVDAWKAAFATLKRTYTRKHKKCGRAEKRNGKKTKNGSHRVLAAAIDYSYLDSKVVHLISSSYFSLFSISSLEILDVLSDALHTA